MEEPKVPADTSMEEKRTTSPQPLDGEHNDLDDNNSQYKVFVGGISRTTDEDEIYTIFRKYNPKEVMIMREIATQRPRGFGFITFGSQKDMDWAIEDMHNTRINGRVVTVSKARPFERPRGDRSPRRQSSPDRRQPMPNRRDGDRDFPRRYQNHHHDHDNGQRQQHYDNRRRPYDSNVSSRRHVPEGRKQDDGPPTHTSYPPSNYDNRNGRGDFGGDHDGRRSNYRQSGPRTDDYHNQGRGDGNRQGQWMDYDRRQQMRDREEGQRRWHQNDNERRGHGGGGGQGHYNAGSGRDSQPRWREQETDGHRRRDGPYLDNRGENSGPRGGGGGGYYGPVRRRADARRAEPYRHRSRSFDRRGR